MRAGQAPSPPGVHCCAAKASRAQAGSPSVFRAWRRSAMSALHAIQTRRNDSASIICNFIFRWIGRKGPDGGRNRPHLGTFNFPLGPPKPDGFVHAFAGAGSRRPLPVLTGRRGHRVREDTQAAPTNLFLRGGLASHFRNRGHGRLAAPAALAATPETRAGGVA